MSMCENLMLVTLQYKRFSEQYRVYLSVVKSAAEFDCLHALAKTSSSLGEPSVRPEIVDSPCAFVDFEQLRHPCLLSADIDFIPNDVQLGGNKQNMALITGPNMAGKSTLLRMTAAAVIMAQVGCYVPATKARIAPFDKICTRMGANDFIFNATSTFKVEMDDCKKIISESTPRSLVILDELGRVSTFEICNHRDHTNVHSLLLGNFYLRRCGHCLCGAPPPRNPQDLHWLLLNPLQLACARLCISLPNSCLPHVYGRC